ncbi:universal stress protein [Rubritepida flocculans]|uniref:universal stress protein n=1 Tax=Rubritepida flocculans TaxID=182403 RepID=UPI00048775D3|nr:universal stress protein [Rubritepida flocculans]
MTVDPCPAKGPILAATDLSARSDRALRRAALLARGGGRDLLVLHVLDAEWPASLAGAHEAEAWRLLARQLEGLPEFVGLPCRPAMERGLPEAAILRAAEAERAACLVLGEHRRGGLRDLFAGTTVERVIRAAARPVLMVHQPPSGPYRRVLVATDFSAPAARAPEAAAALGLFDGAALLLAHALEPPRLLGLGDAGLAERAGAVLEESVREEAMRGLAAAAAALPAGAGSRIVFGAPAEALAALAREWRAELIVLGTRGAGVLRQALIGSVAAEILARPPCDVLAVPPA